MWKYQAKYPFLRQIGQPNVLEYEVRNIFFASTARPQPHTTLTRQLAVSDAWQSVLLHADHFAPAFAFFDLFSHFDGDLKSAMTWRHGHHERLQRFLLILYSLFSAFFFIFL